MVVLTPAERRAALLLVALLALGAAYDLIGGRAAGRGGARRSADSAWSAAPAPDSMRAGGPGAAPGAGPPAIDLNRADARALDALPGIGPVLAARIVEHRARFGAFHAPEDLRAVRGIGPKLYARLEPLVRVGPAPAPLAPGAAAAPDSGAGRTEPRPRPSVRSAPGGRPDDAHFPALDRGPGR